MLLQCATENQGKLMIEGEFASLSEIAKYNPALAPKPYAHGQFKESQIPSESRCISLALETSAARPIARYASMKQESLK